LKQIDRSPLQEPPIRKAVIAVSAQNDVIEHPDCEHLTALFEASRNFLILLARHWVAGRMIVDEHNGRCPEIKRRSVHVARPNKRRGQCSRRDYFVSVDPILVVQHKQDKMLFVGV
jgi:hypothetical protein